MKSKFFSHDPSLSFVDLIFSIVIKIKHFQRLSELQHTKDPLLSE